MKNKLMLFIFCFLCLGKTYSVVKMPSIFTNNMVLQQQADVSFWGEASPNKIVKISTSWNNSTVETTADENGRWKTTISTPAYGGPYSVEISDGKKIKFENVMIGEVWLCSGQSNMEMPLSGWGKIINYEQEVAAANYPNIRLFTVVKNVSLEPLCQLKAESGGWLPCSPQTVAGFSAVAYFFGKNLYDNKNIPIGLINSTWGGTNVESWTSSKSLKEIPDFRSALEIMESKEVNTERLIAQYKADSVRWHKQVLDADKGFQDSKPIWTGTDLNETGWEPIHVPGRLEDEGLQNFDGVVWLRKTIDIPAEWQRKKLHLSLDMIDDYDITFFNGVEVGRTDGWSQKRNYTIPATLVRAGKAVITVRVFDTGGSGGLYGEDSKIKLSLSPDKFINLTGSWLYRIGFNQELAGIPGAPVKWDNANQLSALYNAMINPLIPFSIRGAIWYQGENNANRAYQYRDLFPLLIKDWRKQWNSDFPFYFVQLANFTDVIPEPADAAWAELREAQLKTLHLEKTGMAVTIDIGDAADIHPKNKQEVGRRLSLIARAKTYGENITYSGPVYDTYRVEKNSIRISFKHTGKGLKTSDGEIVKGFAVAGPDHVFHWADAKIVANEVIVSCKEVENPVAVRYAWAANPVCNLINTEGLPASPFRTDDWKGITYNKK
ncbi:MAG: sialate O-acetylesterase [Paludibacter sp.]|nr:sialate O-acetylesterase [Paludibacter sp.]